MDAESVLHKTKNVTTTKNVHICYIPVHGYLQNIYMYISPIVVLFKVVIFQVISCSECYTEYCDFYV